MIIDARRDVSNDAKLPFDVCIVGSGPAGLTLALELAPRGYKIAVLEAGGYGFSKSSQEFYKGQVSGSPNSEHLGLLRYRQFGGTSTAWGGRCLMFDPIDFEPRTYVPDSGWPIPHQSVAAYYKRALQRCEAGPMVYDAAAALPGRVSELVAGMPDDDVVSSTLERWSPPTDFGKRYMPTLWNANNIVVLVNAACIAVNLDEAHKHVASLTVRAGSEKSFLINADMFVLAAGSIEVARLLLSSNHQIPQGVGNRHDLVGRYYMTHHSGIVATAHMQVGADAIANDYCQDADGVYVRRRISFSESAQRREHLPNLSFQFHHQNVVDPEHRNSMLSALFLAKHIGSIRRGIPPGLGFTDDKESEENAAVWIQHLGNLIVDAPNLIRFLPRFVYLRFMRRRRIPSLVLSTKKPIFPLHYHAEQFPNRNSRLLLDKERDAYGVPRVRLEFQVHDCDFEGIYRAHVLLDEHMRRHRVGQVQFHSERPLADIRREVRAVNGHFIGTTRMSDDERRGVVDANCKVFGLSNLFIASGSVFPTSSHANPTLTIVAMAIRLAEHLRKDSPAIRVCKANGGTKSGEAYRVPEPLSPHSER